MLTGAGRPGSAGRETMGNNPSTQQILVPHGAAHFPLAAPGPTRRYAFLLVPDFTILAFSSAIDTLRIANQLSQRPLYHWTVYSADGAPVASSSGVCVVVDGAMEEVGRDVALFVCAGNDIDAPCAPGVVAAVARHHRFGGMVGGLCTGALALARAGLLSSGRFTLHWENQPAFVERFPHLQPTPHQFEVDDRVITCGGGAAATDMILSMIARDHGAAFATAVSEMCLRHVMIGTERSQRSSIGAVAYSRNPALIAIVGLMTDHLEDTLSMDELATAAGYSRRHIERLFVTSLGMTPAAYYRKLRLDQARNLLSSTEMGLLEIAMATGFGNVSHLSKAFRARFGCPPSQIGHRRRRAKKG